MAQAGLLPFRKQQGNEVTDCWTSNDWQSCHALGSTYPDLEYTGEEALKHLNYLYEWSVPLESRTGFGRPPQEMLPLDLSRSEFFGPNIVGKEGSALSAKDHVKHMQAYSELGLERGSHLVKTMTASNDGYSKEWFVDDKVQR